MRLENAQNRTSVSFTSEDSLQAYQQMLVHYGVSSNDSLFRLISLIPDTVLDDPSMKRIWSTGLQMDDTWGELRLIYQPASEEELIDEISYGEAIGLVAENQYFADTLLVPIAIKDFHGNFNDTYHVNLKSSLKLYSHGILGSIPLAASFCGSPW